MKHRTFLLNIRRSFNCEFDEWHRLSRVVVAFLSSDPQKPPGHGLGQPAAADPALSRRLDGMIPRGAHQPQFSVRPWAEVAALLAVPSWCRQWCWKLCSAETPFCCPHEVDRLLTGLKRRHQGPNSASVTTGTSPCPTWVSST